MAISAGALVDSLTEGQRNAAGSRYERIFVEAGPGTGKTTVSAFRFGALRFDPEARGDPRAVLAVSFTRAATKHLRRRIQRTWGPTALAWPHRVVTLDTVMVELLHALLSEGLVKWPGGHVVLEVHDSWRSFGSSSFNRTSYQLELSGDTVVAQRVYLPANRPGIPGTEILPHIQRGVATHEDVRSVLEQALAKPEMRAFIEQRLRTSTRALIVDEVFDANDLDITVIEVACAGQIELSAVGDPWQALYVFRGARPDAVPKLIERSEIHSYVLDRSFRWETDEQRNLASELRAGRPVDLAPVTIDSADDLDVVLGLTWKELWDLGGSVLPLAFHGFKGGFEEAAATLLLDYVTRTVLDERATYLRDALTALAIKNEPAVDEISGDLQRVVELLRGGGRSAPKNAYLRLIDGVAKISPRQLRAPHPSHTTRLKLIGERLAHPGRPIKGLTSHQAKGGEWDLVGVRLDDHARQRLTAGLSVDNDSDRKLYVACTRARRRTVSVEPKE
ncbi:UvrD-helicase domain-containing protein [Isoptericola sp. b515]|uniref:UvrD-helicase domain-containing protein n=1 Tax=Isoptericola sp. b515 TaxID=3064652 RepID=UPI0027136289|nr:UvrD-helicase domain-containing protein [Isoptericola sp. b515]MDO8148741.1 UvrD-helicase domain-containing protein [Isoptericola sp. b515]